MMETDPTGENLPTPESPDEPRAEPFQNDEPEPPRDELAAEDDPLLILAERALSGRLPPADEERATTLLRETLLAGKKEIARAVEALPKLPWIVGVRAVETAWAEMKATARTQLLKGLAETESDAARRVRLSLARALFKQDVPLALKIAGAVAKEMRETESGELSPKHAQIFSGVFIGKAKPWVVQLPLAELKPAEASALAGVALLTVFSAPHPPVTQLAILKWVAPQSDLEKLDEPILSNIARHVSRWSAKWQNALRTEVSPLPAQIEAVLRPQNASGETSRGAAEEEEMLVTPAEGLDAPATTAAPPSDAGEAGRKIRPVYEPRPQKSAGAQEATRQSTEARSQQKERPVYQPRGNVSRVAQLDLGDTLRQIEGHVQWLRAELSAAQGKLRQREDEGRRSKRPTAERGTTVVEGEQTIEELARTNYQLESRITELQSRIADLLSDAEDRAASMAGASGESASDADAQLRTLLALKLQDAFSDFQALERESPSVVVQQHYRALMQQIFEVLRQQNIPLKE